MYLDAGDSFLFRDKDDSSAIRARLYTATGKFSGSDQIDRVGPDLKTTFTSAFKKKEDEDKDADATEELKETLSKLDAGYKEQQKIDKEKADALLAQQQAAAKKYLQQLENKRAEAEANRAKAREQEEKDAAEATRARTKVSRIFEKQGGPSAKELHKGTKRTFKEGGIASKPKQKPM